VTRAYAVFEIKSVDTAQRIVEGIASTPSVDRGGDSMDPLGAQFALPLPFKWKHGDAVGEVFHANVTPDGIRIRAKISKLADSAPADLKARVEHAWYSITADPPLARGLSIGWGGIESQPLKGGRGTRWTKWLLGEVSIVEIPMNQEASITAIKSLDAEDRAASGLDPEPGDPAGVSATLPVFYGGKPKAVMKTYTEQITELSAKRTAHVARLEAIQQKAADDGRTKDAAEREESDTIKAEIAAMDTEIKDLGDLEAINRTKAQPLVTPTTLITPAASHTPVIRVQPNVPQGTAFTRMAMCIAAAKGDSFRAMELSRRFTDSTPEVELMVKAAVAAGDTANSTWAGPLAVAQPLVNEFLELLRPRTLLGQIPGLRRVPFNVSVPSQTTGGTYGWVGQNKPKAVTKADYSTVTLTFAKAAGIIVLTEELVKISSPSAEALVREEMIAGMSQFLDTQFIDPAVTASAGVNPASLTNGASTAAAAGATAANAKADLVASVQVFTAANVPLEGSVWLMSDSNAFGLAQSMNALGQPMFPGFGGGTGSIYGMPVIISNNVGNRVVLVHAPSILYADDGGVSIDVSREATVQMDSAPTDTVDATTVYISLWQRNLVGLRAERFITWIRGRTAAVRYISSAAYTGA
jgi:HK97 family phage major capsid protein